MTFELLLLICNDPPLGKYGYFLESHINVFSVVCQFGHPGALSQDVRLVFLRRWNKATGLLVFNNVNNIDDFTEGADDDDGIVSDDKISSSTDTGISLII